MDTDKRKLTARERMLLAAAQFEEYQRITFWFIIGFACLVLMLWSWAWVVDPGNAPATLNLHIASTLIAILSGLFLKKNAGIVSSGIVLYMAMAFIEVLYLLMTVKLEYGFMFGLGGYLYFFISSVLLGQPFPFIINAVGCITLTILPHIIGYLLFPTFPHIHYLTFIWPAAVICTFFHWFSGELIIDKLHYRHVMEKRSMHDPLTGLMNRRALQEEFFKLRNLAERENRNISLILLDIDHFKLVNDTHGHRAGDLVLKRMASLLDKTSRASDTVSRVGGEEFVCLLPSTDLDEAELIADRLRKAVGETRLPLSDKPDSERVTLTISLGVTQMLPQEDLDQLIERADRALYEAKAKGRNYVIATGNLS